MMLCKKDVTKAEDLCNLVQVKMLVLNLFSMPFEIYLLIDAENAFNSINRKVMLHNLKFICPVIATCI